jgi:hypothetical protein
MWDGQSTGLGINAGDQQYVKGILSVSARAGPSVAGTASKFNVCRLHLLITSPNLGQTLTFLIRYDVQKHSPLPRHEIHDAVGDIIRQPRIRTRILQIGQRMWEGPRTAPRHGEHEMHRHPQCLGAVHVGERGRIRNDGVGHKRRSRDAVGLNARLPEAVEHAGDHCTLVLDVAGAQALHARDQPRVLDHVGHEFGGVSADGVELEAGVAHEGCEGVVRCKADAVAVFLEAVAEGDEGLHIPTAADYLDDDVELHLGLKLVVYIFWWWCGGNAIGKAGCQSCQCLCKPRVNVNIDSAIGYDG